MLEQFQEMLELRASSDRLDKYAALMMELPKKFDQALTLAAENHARLPLQGTRGIRRREQQNSSAVVIALLLALVAVVLLSHHLAASAVVGVWVDRLGAVAFMAVGALLLRAASRTW
jgi:hypothetical protein